MNSNNPKRTIRFGLIGCGTISPTHAEAIAELSDAELVACCDTVPTRATVFAARHGISQEHTHTSLDAFLADTSVDVVTVCSPSGLHAELGSRVLASGRPVIVEKPMDIDLAGCDRLIAAQRAVDLPLGVISQHRFDPASIQARRLIDQGRIGKLLLVEAQIKWYRTQEYYDSGDWRGTWRLDGGGCLMNQGVHTVDLMRWLAGPVKTVYAVARTAAHERIEVEDVICASLTFQNGAIGNVMASTAVYPGYPASLSLHGQTGSVVISGDALQDVEIMGEESVAQGDEQAASGHAVLVARGGTKSAQSAPIPARSAQAGFSGAMPPPGTAPDSAYIESDEPTVAAWEWGDAHSAQLRDFVQAVRAGRHPAVDGESGRQAVELVTAIYESVRTGNVVNL